MSAFHSSIMVSQQMSNNKKRQLFSKMQEHQTETKNDENKTKQNTIQQDEKNNNHQPSSSNSLSSTKDFIPSPQFGNYHQQSTYYNHQHSPQHNTHPQPNQDNNHFQPSGYESYTTNSPYSSYNPPAQHSKWADQLHQHQPISATYLPPQDTPHLSDLNKNYPKFEEYAKHLQKENHSPQQWFPPASKEKGKFVWLPEGDEIKFNIPKPEYEPKHNIKNGTGKWKWIPDDHSSLVNIGDQPELKIVAHGPTQPTYYEQIKIYQEPKPVYITSKDHPYQFDHGTEQTPSVFNDGFSNEDNGHNSYHYSNHDSPHHEYDLETTTEPPKNHGMNLVDVLFNVWNQNEGKPEGEKGKEKDKGLEQPRKKQ